VAAAGLFRRDRVLLVTLLQSDLCQQVFRHPTFRPLAKSRLENRFGGWPAMLLNAVLDLALEEDADVVHTPTAAQIVRTTRQPVAAPLFERIYDAPVARYRAARTTVDGAEHWAIPLAENRSRVVRLRPEDAPPAAAPDLEICVVHDIEEDLDTPVTPAECRASLERMLELEARHAVRATYSVVATLYPEKRALVAPPGHAVAFHSYNHRVAEPDQLRRARAVDLQVRGYRPPRSILDAELSDYELAYVNFDWLLSSAWSFGFAEPRLAGGIAKIPIHLDDYALFRGELDYGAWLAEIRALLGRRRFVAIGLHDCYGAAWLPRYDALLAELRGAGALVTAEEVADRLFRASDRSGRAALAGAAR
jgi:hypothetical protein